MNSVFFSPNSTKNEFVHSFLEESEDTKKSFRNYLTFSNVKTFFNFAEKLTVTQDWEFHSKTVGEKQELISGRGHIRT